MNGHGCSGHPMHSNMDVTMVWAWQPNMMLILVEVRGCSRGAVALPSITPLRAHVAVKHIAD